MSLLDLIFKWFGKPEETPGMRPADADGDDDADAAVAVLDAPEGEEGAAPFAGAQAGEEPADDAALSGDQAEPHTDVEPPIDPLLAQYPDAWWIPKGEPITTTQRSAFRQTEMDGNLYEALVAVLRDPALELPRMSHVAQRGLQLLSNVDVDFGRLARIFETDPAIAAEILKVANSPLYRGVREINRLDLAIARLGRKRLHSIVLALTMRGLAIRTGAKTMGEALWKRSLAAGVIMSEFADKAHVNEDEAFLVGILHDVGQLAILRIAHDYQTTHGRKVPRELFEHVTLEWHGHIGVRLAEAWNLPAPLPDLIGQHHADPAEDDPLASWRRLIQFADVACDMLGYGTYAPYDLFALPCTRALGLSRNRPVFEHLSRLPVKIEERLQMF